MFYLSASHTPTLLDSNAVVLDVPLEYTIDTGTGLKSTGRPKEDKILHAHRFLAGLPGAKAPQKRYRILNSQ